MKIGIPKETRRNEHRASLVPRDVAKLKKKKALSYAFEEIKNGNGERLVNLGCEAGLVGITEGLRIWGAIREIHGKRNPFKKLLSSVEYRTKKKIYSVVSKLKTMILPHVMKVADGGELSSGMMTKNGKFVYQRAI